MSISIIAFMSPQPIGEYEYRKWRIQYLIQQGFTVYIFNFGSQEKSPLREIPNLETEGFFLVHIKNTLDFKEYIVKLSNSTIFIDYLVGHSNLDYKWEKIFRLIKKFHLNYFVISSGVMPELHDGVNTTTQSLAQKMSSIRRRPRTALEFLSTKIILALTRQNIIYPKPMSVFGTNSPTLRRFVSDRRIKLSSVIYVNAYDYDLAIKYVKENAPIPEKKYAVFLDENATEHQDFFNMGEEPAERELYFPPLIRFFRSFQRETGMEVIVASHPKSLHNSPTNNFQEFKLVRMKTMELVANAEIVLMHASAAVSFAVVFNKPIVHLLIPGLDTNHKINRMVIKIANELGNTPLDLKSLELNQNRSIISEVNATLYERYIENYLANREMLNLNEWEIIVKQIKELNDAKD